MLRTLPAFLGGEIFILANIPEITLPASYAGATRKIPIRIRQYRPRRFLLTSPLFRCRKVTVVRRWVHLRGAFLSSERLPALDGLRAISILLVLACHMLPLGPKVLQLNEAAGAMGMSLFFALSGFLIVSGLIYNADCCGIPCEETDQNCTTRLCLHGFRFRGPVL